ncbi:6432_t:CDS:2, partial [Paraglomus brasilianum]
MDETYNNDFCQQLQISKDRNAVRNRRDCGVTAETSASLIDNCMGRRLFPVGIPCQTEENDTGLSSPNAKTLGQSNHDDGNRHKSSSNDDKHHRKTTKTNITDTRQPQADNEFESRKNTSVAVVSFECCPNRRKIKAFEPSLGELFRVGSFVGTFGTSKWTTEEPTTPCHLVFPNRFPTPKIENRTPMYNVSEDNGPCESSDACNSSFMLVEKIKNGYDRYRIATSVCHDIWSESKGLDITDLTDDMEGIKEFGFNHIIVVGERDYGMLFLDCYGRIFDWDHINFLLWPLGNYLENKLDEHKNVAWSVENGSVTEFKI